jgi:hypothetical protein
VPLSWCSRSKEQGKKDDFIYDLDISSEEKAIYCGRREGASGPLLYQKG